MATLGRGSTRNVPPPTLLQSARGYLATWVELLKTRLDLFSVELQEERERIQQILVLAVAALVCLVFGVLLVTLFVVVVFWDTEYRLVVLGGFALLYLASGVAAGLIARHKSRSKPRIFSATLNELTKDVNRLSS